MSCAAGASPGVLTLIAPRNGIFRQDFTFADDSGPLDFTGWSARMQVRAGPGSTPAYLDVNSSAPTPNSSQILFTDPTNGVLEIFLSNGDLVTLPSGSPVANPASFAYDLVLTEPGGDFAPYLQGAFLLTEGVTR